ncbi:MAG: matrixin family metalloprotease [Bdellovibrionaceae bacterium]|nr:matrixin family metalloprotease [Pseudobdellovibrionaceae bacterium]
MRLKSALLLLLTCIFAINFLGCAKGNYLGPESSEFLATAAQEDCGYLQNEFGQRVSWKDNLPIEFYISKTIPTEFHQDILEAAEIWNGSVGKTIVRINMSGLEDSVFATNDKRNVIYGFNEWDEGKSTQQALTIVKYHGNLITSADIKVNFQDMVYYSKDPQNSQQVHFGSLIVHEIGHSLGLKHANMKPTVMWYSLASGLIRTQLSKSDRISLECEYK